MRTPYDEEVAEQARRRAVGWSDHRRERLIATLVDVFGDGYEIGLRDGQRRTDTWKVWAWFWFGVALSATGIAILSVFR